MLNIPAIEWDKKTTDGISSIGSNVITGISSTIDVIVGMSVYSAAFPYNTRVLSKTVDSITLSSNATAVETAFEFYRRYDFEYPPKRDDGEQVKASQTRVKSLSGRVQTVTNHLEATRSLSFSFVNKTDRDLLRDSFYFQWAILGKEFRYFEDQDINAILNYENDTSDYKQKREVKKHPDYLYQLDFTFRRVL
jgi:hypothetical protein